MFLQKNIFVEETITNEQTRFFGIRFSFLVETWGEQNIFNISTVELFYQNTVMSCQLNVFHVYNLNSKQFKQIN